MGQTDKKRGRGERGEARFASVTFSKLVEFTGLKLRQVRYAAASGKFDRMDLADTVRWVNEVRAKKGLRPIGEVDPPPAGPIPASPAQFLPRLPSPSSGGYDPLKASF